MESRSDSKGREKLQTERKNDDDKGGKKKFCPGGRRCEEKKGMKAVVEGLFGKLGTGGSQHRFCLLGVCMWMQHVGGRGQKLQR